MNAEMNEIYKESSFYLFHLEPVQWNHILNPISYEST